MNPPARIVSVVPSQTELLADLGLSDQIVGITKFCVHPESLFRSKTRIGGTKTLHLEKILSLQPDLVLANKEENTREQIEFLASRVPVWVSDIQTFDDALHMIREVGRLTGKPDEAADLANRIRSAFEALEQEPKPEWHTAYLIWNEPLMAAANETFIHHMMDKAGFKNVFANRRRYPEISPAELAAADPDVLLLSSEPYPFSEKHIAYFKMLCPGARVLLADGELFSWYGSRLLLSPPYFRKLRQLFEV